MSEQLSLFEGEDAQGPAAFDAEPEAEPDTGAIDELFRSTARWRSSREYVALLEFISRFPAYSPLNAFLIFLQDPGASCVATARNWLRKYRRRPKPGARPLVILAPMSPLRFVFDLRDTEGQPLTVDPRTPAGTADRLPAKIHENTLHNCGVQRISVRETEDPAALAEGAAQVTPAIRKRWPALAIEAQARYLIPLPAHGTLEAKYAALVLELAYLFCGHLGIDSDAWWPERIGLELARMDIEAASAAFLVCRRRGLESLARDALAPYRDSDRTLPPVSLNAVLQAVSQIEAMGKSPWRRPRKKGRY
jgi:hypothetical protein